MAVGRISGPLLKSNLLRNGIDIAFESDLLYLDVNNQRIGIKTDTPTNELEIAGTTQTSDLLAGSVIVDNIKIDNNSITSTNTDGVIRLAPNGNGDFEVESDKFQLGSLDENVVFTTQGTGDLTIHTNNGTDSGSIYIPTGANEDITVEPDGTGNVVISADTTVVGDLDVSGNSQFANNDNLVLNSDRTVSSAPFIVAGGSVFENNLITSGQAIFADLTNSTSVNTGSVVIDGGVGIEKTVNIGENLFGSGIDTSAIDGFEIDGGTY